MPYTEADEPFFFGREADTEVITANLLASRITVLYGASGVGRGSILHAGVLAHLRRTVLRETGADGRPRFAVVLFNTWRDNPAAALLAAIARQYGDTPAVSDVDLAGKVRGWTTRNGSDLLIILDQFEEYFLYNPGEREKGTFASEFPRLVNQQDLRVSFILSLREDALARLDRFKGAIPNLLENTLRLEHLDREAAEQAIRGPVRRFNELNPGLPPMSVEDELVAAVLEEVKRGNVVLGDAGRGTISKQETRIETPYLQLVMTRLWNEETKLGSTVLRASTFRTLGGAQNIVRSHLDAAIAALSPEEQKIAAKLFTQLVTPSRTKIAQTAADLAGYAEIPEPQVQGLLEKLSSGENRILTPVAPAPDSPGTPRYQIFHDVLAASILDWRNRRRADELARERELEARRNSRLRSLVWGLAVLLVLTAAAGGWAYYETRKARQSAREAEYERQSAQAAEVSAQAAQDLADSRFLELQAAGLAKSDQQSAAALTQQADAAQIWSQAASDRAKAKTLSAEAIKASSSSAAAALVQLSQTVAKSADSAQTAAQQLFNAAVKSAPQQTSLPYARGIDVSRFQGVIDWKAVAGSGVQFAYIKASQGITPDATFAGNWQGAKAAGIRRGAYQVLGPAAPATQVEAFLTQIEGFSADDLPPAVAVPFNASDPEAGRVTRWIQLVKNKTGREAVASIPPTLLHLFAGGLPQRMWTAAYTGAPDSTVQWNFWQYSNKGQIPGIRGLVNLDYFHGSPEELKAFH